VSYGNSTADCAHYLGMDCNACREAISALLDNEDPGIDPTLVEAHVAGCPACRAHVAQARRLQGWLRRRPAELVPDLTPAILAHIGPTGPGPRQGAEREVRIALAVLAALVAILPLPAPLLGDDAGAPLHLARELGAFQVALAVGLLLAAWQPQRRAQLLPVVAVLSVCPAVIAALDVAAGRTPASAEGHHLLQLAGLGLVWLLAYSRGRARPVAGR
jgi:predicted anti-sigma-YlaC factor YlaD